MKWMNNAVTTAENGFQALQWLETGNFDLILMDVQMPIMDGLTACAIIRESEKEGDLSSYSLPAELKERLRGNRRGKHIPIIAMTANAMEGDRKECLEAGMDNYLTKPFDPYIKPDVLEGMFVDIVEHLDKQEFDLSKSLSMIGEKELA